MGAIFVETLRRTWRQAVYWGIGLGAMALLIMLVIPNVDTLEQYREIVETMPPILLQAFGISDADTLATPEGFLSYGFFTYAILILAVYAVIAGLNITANEEDSGIMDVVLTLPVKRWQIVVEKFAAYALLLVVILLVSAVGIVAGELISDFEVDDAVVAQSFINTYPPVVLMLAFTAFVATVVRRRGTASVIAIVFIVGSYFVNFVGRAASGSIAESLANASFFYYADTEAIIRDGLVLSNVVGLLAASLALAAAALWFWQRRDVGL